MQTNRELIEAAFNNRPVNRIPTGFWWHFLNDPSGDESFQSPELTILRLQKQVEFIQTTRPDFVKVMTDGFFHHPHLKNLSSIHNLDELTCLSDDDPWFTQQLEYAKTVKKVCGDELHVFYNIFSFATTMKLSQDQFLKNWSARDPWLIHILQEDEDVFSRVSSIISSDLARLGVRLMTEAGISGIYFSTQNVLGLSRETYDRLIAPGERAILEAVNTVRDFSILHICGFKGHMNNITWYADYPVKAVNWAVKIEGIPLEEGHKVFGDRAVIGGFGNGTDDVLYKGSKQEIQAETKQIIANAGTRGVLLGADCTIPKNTPIAHLEWVREAARLD